MARSELTVTDITREPGVEQPAQEPSDATNDHFIAENAGDVLLEIENENVASKTVEIVPNPTLSADGLPVGNLVLTIPAGETWLFGPFRQTTFKQDASGMLYINPEISTDLKFRAYRLPRPSQT